MYAACCVIYVVRGMRHLLVDGYEEVDRSLTTTPFFPTAGASWWIMLAYGGL